MAKTNHDGKQDNPYKSKVNKRVIIISIIVIIFVVLLLVFNRRSTVINEEAESNSPIALNFVSSPEK